MQEITNGEHKTVSHTVFESKSSRAIGEKGQESQPTKKINVICKMCVW